ncbi:hypothetical protein Btru_045618 [Bulinus truncatus]|nr:hypothetical protein Btru_045618 [Bulinus truncatus]
MPAGRHCQQPSYAALPKDLESLVATMSTVIPGVCMYFCAKSTSCKTSPQKNKNEIKEKSHIAGNRLCTAPLVSTLSSTSHRASMASTNLLNFYITGFTASACTAPQDFQKTLHTTDFNRKRFPLDPFRFSLYLASNVCCRYP